MRYFLNIAYKGTNYHGWQIQANAHSIQEEIQNKLSILLKEKVEIIGSGRTDTGVHATQQVAHLDSNQVLTEYEHLYRMNALLPSDIVIKGIQKVSDDAHARFDANLRSYEYHMSKTKNPFLTDLLYVNHNNYDMTAMNEAAMLLKQHKDFECFSKVKTEVNNFLCTISEARWVEQKNMLIFKVSANRFLRGMVRAIVGTLLEVGLQKTHLEDFRQIILSKDRKQAGRAVPPQGLFLTQVKYPYTTF